MKRTIQDLTPALFWGGEGISFAELEGRSGRVAGALAALGVGGGDRVVTVTGTSPRTVELIHAVARLGATLVPLNTRLSAAEFEALIDDAEPRLVVCDRSLADLVGPVRERWRVVEAGQGIDDAAGGDPPASRPVDPDSIHSILYTSGTTGRPKGAMLTHRNFRASALASRQHLGVAPADRWLAMLPLHHVGGLSILVRSALDGVPVVLHERFDPVAANRAIREQGVTLVSVVATMLRRMLDANGEDLYPSSLRCVLVGGGPVPADLIRRSIALGIPVVPTYGLTEAASQVATATVGGAAEHPASSGRPLPGTEVRIDAPDAEGRGEILVRGATVMAGYFRCPRATAETLRDGWLHTGDVGHLDAEGRLFVHDRRTDLIISGGENVYPAEVEAVLLSHPAVLDAAVYGTADPEWGQRVAAAVVRREGVALEEEDLRQWCAPRLARYKTPRTIRFVSDLPRTASGKVRRFLLETGEGRGTTGR